jgi:hypothetical protein
MELFCLCQIETNRDSDWTVACFQGRPEVVSLLVDRKESVSLLVDRKESGEG